MDSNQHVAQNLELQLSELEMLNSMFPNEGELKLTDPGVISDIQDFLSGKVEREKLSKLEFNINLDVMETRVVINVSLPDLYPEKPPQISVHSGILRRLSHNEMNMELLNFLRTLEPGLLYVGSVVEWVQQNFPTYLSPLESGILPILELEDKKTTRMWIHSHHIYSKTKMKNIEDWAKELNLTGFLLPGKPGFICAEGLEKDCNTWWQRVRGMNWAKISCKLEEHDEVQKFQEFSNIAKIRASDSSGMKAFINYLEEHHSSHVFKEYFGFDQK